MSEVRQICLQNRDDKHVKPTPHSKQVFLVIEIGCAELYQNSTNYNLGESG
jgi:hypothetical protein